MHKSSTKRYLTIILLANFAIIALIGVHILLQNIEKKVDVPPTYVHSRVRNSFVKEHQGTNIEWSQNIGGSLDENAIAVFESQTQNNNIFVFGNTQSYDFDFDFEGGFLAKLDQNGKTIEFVQINKDLFISKVIQFESGYLLLQDGGLDGNIVAASIMSLSGKMISTWSTNDNANILANDLILDYSTQNSIIIIYSRSLGVLGDELVAVRLPIGLNTVYQPPTTLISTPFGLKFLNAYILEKELLIFANEGVRTFSNTVAITFQVGASPNFVRINNANGPNFDYTTIALQPFSHGFVMASIANTGPNAGTMYLLSLTSDLKFSLALTTRLQGVTFAKIIQTKYNFYLFAYNGQGGNMFVTTIGIVATLQPLDGFDQWRDITSFVHTDFDANEHIFVGTTNRGIGINVLKNDSVQFAYIVGGTKNENESSPLMLVEQNSILIVANTKSASLYSQDGDVVRNFGQSDVWIAQIRVQN